MPTTARRPATAAEPPTAPQRREEGGMVRWGAINVPVTHTRVPVPVVRAPGRGTLSWSAQAIRANLPPTDRLIFYGGLGAMAVVGVLEWPVAVSVGAGVWLAARAADRGARRRATA